MAVGEPITAQHPVLAVLSILIALTGGDVVALVTIALSGGLVGAIGTTVVGLRKQRSEATVSQASVVTEARTVAAATAESAMKVMNDALDRVVAEADADRARFDRRLADCESECQTCRQRWEGHASVCPLLGGTPPS